MTPRPPPTAVLMASWPQLLGLGLLLVGHGGLSSSLGRLGGLGLLRSRCPRRALALFDQLLDLLSTLAADLLVEVRPPGGFHAIAALLADLLVELRAALGLDRLAALPADLLVEGATPLRLHGRAALSADRLVELA